ncbi:MAG: hypothetical protein JWO06_1235 [Bacteroidota bacterium]|nr:hypothetical protein [Bacteroidota bacterium]
MRKKYLVLSVVLVAMLAIINTPKVNSHIIYPPVASCGDPTNAGITCAQSGCHASNQASNSSLLALKIDTTTFLTGTLDANFKYIPNQTYYIGFQTLAAAYAFGFQIASLDASNAQAGNFAVSDAVHTKLQTAGGIQYMGHLHANHTISSWVFKWTAPASGAVTFYYAFNPADSSSFVNSIPGAPVYFSNLTINPLSVGITDISDKLSNLNVFPNPISNEFGLSFNLKQSEEITASVYTMDGKLANSVINEKIGAGNFYRTFDISHLASGVYLVQLNVGGAVVTKKIIKE